VGEEVRRLEGRRVVGGKRKHGDGEGEDKRCIPWTEGGGGGGRKRRKRRKAGRVSNILKTFEQGEKQRNKITFYILKKDGHPSAGEKLRESGADVRLRGQCESSVSESDVMGSASKRPRRST
jgi:hypothetical protein